MTPFVLSACSAPRLAGLDDPFLKRNRPVETVTAPFVPEKPAAAAASINASEGRTRLSSPSPKTGSQIIQASAESIAPDSDFNPTAFANPTHSGRSPQLNPATFTPAIPRRRVTNAAFEASDDQSSAILAAADEFPDEYLFDGGDRNAPFHYEGNDRAGLNTEDTIVEYNDSQGRNRVMPTNRVAVYAPRFGAVCTYSGPDSGIAVFKAAGAHENTIGAGLHNRLAGMNHEQRESIEAMRMRSRASGLEVELPQLGLRQKTLIAAHTKLEGAQQDLSFLYDGQFRHADEARLAYGIHAAVTWSREQYPILTAEAEGPQSLEARFKPSELVGLKDEKTPGQMRIVKLADKEFAPQGDVMTFTIRYDNLGQKELTNVRIVDNLTPRLEYVDDSATSDRAGRLVVQDNEEGTLVLIFELAEPLKGGTGGVVTFKARVR